MDGHPDAPPPQAPDELDLLIGELEGEAARRRAEPGFPLEADGRIRRELDERSPGRRPATATELVGAVLDAGHRQLGRPKRRSLGGSTPGELEELATATAVALQTLFDRIAAPPPGRPPANGPGWLLATWPDLAARRPDPVVCSGADASPLVQRLTGNGRAADLAPGTTQLATRLGGAPNPVAVVLVSPVVADAHDLSALVDTLERAAATVDIVAEAPWSWRRDHPGAAGELSPGRPLSAEAWIEALASAGFTATARYDAAGRSYEVAAERAR